MPFVPVRNPLVERVVVKMTLQFRDLAVRNVLLVHLPLHPHGTPYRLKVWTELAKIPFGQTLTYTQLAARAGGVARSIGGAMGNNPIPIIIPCHRVLAATGLGGFSGGDGLETKRRLLHLEQRIAGQAAGHL